MKLTRLQVWCIVFLLPCFAILAAFNSNGQAYDTLSNWDGIAQTWYVSTPGSQVVLNPAPGEVNSSGHCLKFKTGSGPYDYMLADLSEPVNFDVYPRYRLKVLAPATGGNITLKFENHNNTFWQEIVLTPVPGQWTDLEYDFSGLVYNDLVKMVIFPDFQGTTPGLIWYIDDILKENNGPPPPLILESNLPIFVINTFGVPIQDEPKIDAHLGIIDNGQGSLNNLNDPFTGYDGSIGIEIRGQSSQSFAKDSFGFETRTNTGENLNVPLLGMPPENDWVLYAPYADKSLLRNVISFEIGRKMGNYSSRSVFCELVINGDYKGIYTLMEKIKKDENRVDIATLDPGEITGDDLTGGYIIKVDKLDADFTYGVDGWKSNPVPSYPNAMDIIFQYYYPEADDLPDEQRSYIRDFITTAENTLTSTGFADPEEGYQKYFDVLSFIDFMLLSEIPKEVDKYRYSTFLHKDKDSNGGKLFAGPAWDFDLGYGNVDFWWPGTYYTGWLYSMVEPHEYGIMFWWKRLMEDPYFRNMARTRWTWLRQNQLEDNNIHLMIDSVLTHIEAAKDRNFQRWPILGIYVWPNNDWYGNTFEDEVANFENYLFNRMNWMDGSFTGTILQPQAGISAIASTITVHLYDDYFDDPDLKKSHFQLNNAPGGVSVQSVIYDNASECRLVLSGDVSASPDVTITISEKAVNYWLDITSSPLSAAGTGEPLQADPGLRVFEENGRLHIVCENPDWLSEQAEIINSTGQRMMTARLEKKTENILPHQLRPGLYLLVMKSGSTPSVMKFIVAR